MPRVTYHNLPFQIFQGEGDLLMVYPFAANHRVVHRTDRSELRVDSWMGKSIAEWEQDVLVVTTKWQNGRRGWIRAGNHASNQLTVADRLGPNHIWYEATLDDPAPGLIDIRQDGRTIPALAQVGKSGFMFILNREDGTGSWRRATSATEGRRAGRGVSADAADSAEARPLARVSMTRNDPGHGRRHDARTRG